MIMYVSSYDGYVYLVNSITDLRDLHSLANNCQLKLGKVYRANWINLILDVRVLLKCRLEIFQEICLFGFVDNPVLLNDL